MTDLRDVTVDELFSWRESFGCDSHTLLGGRGYVNQKTYDEIKKRCDRVEQVAEWMATSKRFTDLEINVNEAVPDGLIRPRKMMAENPVQEGLK